MSRGQIDHTHPGAVRCAAVWLLVTGGTAAAWWLVAPTGAALATTTGRSGTFDALLVRVCAAVLLPSTAWLWIVTTVTVIGLLRGRTRTDGAVRRLVLLACGVALATGAVTPAQAVADRDRVADRDGIAGLAMPDRAVAQPVRGRLHVVVPGDSLWSIAGSPHTRGSVDRRWRAIWAANRDLIGDDPDLILPGQRLTLPTTPDDTARRAR